MESERTITIDAKLTLERIERLREKIDAERSAMVRALLSIQLKAIMDEMESGPKGGGGGKLGVRTGALLGSFSNPEVSEIGKSGDDVIGAETGSNMEYAAIHEFGGVIVPVHSKFLIIPTKEALTPKGVEAGWAVELKKAKMRDRALGIDSKKKESESEPLYLFVKKVTIKPTGYISKAMVAADEELRDFAESYVESWMLAAERGGRA